MVYQWMQFPKKMWYTFLQRWTRRWILVLASAPLRLFFYNSRPRTCATGPNIFYPQHINILHYKINLKTVSVEINHKVYVIRNVQLRMIINHNIPTSQLFVDWFIRQINHDCNHVALKQTAIEHVLYGNCTRL